MNEAKGEIEESKEKLQALKSQYDRFKSILGQTQQARSMRVKNPTTYEMISDRTNSTRYHRRQETKDVLEYIHGSEIGAIYGAWDIIAKYASDEIIKKLTNRSTSTGSLGKWWQVMRANYVRAFYLPEHHPMPSPYVPTMIHECHLRSKM